MTGGNSTAYLTAANEPLEIQETSIPIPANDEIVIENKAAAINPIDSIIGVSGFLVRNFPVILGTDTAGVVISVGADVGSEYKKGDRVLAMTETLFSPNQDKGGFQKYSAARTLTATKLPNHVSFTEGCTFPLAVLTAAVGLFRDENLNLNLPQVPSLPQNGKTLLVWGGASSVGASAIQMAVAAGYSVVATASEKNFEIFRQLGATKVLDYRKFSVVEDVIAALSGTDFVGTFMAAASGVSFQQAADVTKAVDGIHHLVGAPLYPKDFKPEIKLGWVDIGIANYSEETRRIARHVFGKYLPEALENKVYKVIPTPRVIGKGIQCFQTALDIMAAGVSAEKLVVEL